MLVPDTRTKDPFDRMRQAGVSVGSTIQILSEMVFNWAESPGPEILEILGGLYAAMAE